MWGLLLLSLSTGSPMPLLDPVPDLLSNFSSPSPSSPSNTPPSPLPSNDTSSDNSSVPEVQMHLFDPKEHIRIRPDDWRDDQPKNDIIWSHESRYHPEFGKFVARVGVEGDRVGRSSQIMSFVILGTVIGFVLYTYLSHVIIVRRLRREIERARLRTLLRSSALIMAHSVNHGREYDFGERRRSILNMFRGFRL